MTDYQYNFNLFLRQGGQKRLNEIVAENGGISSITPLAMIGQGSYGFVLKARMVCAKYMGLVVTNEIDVAIKITNTQYSSCERGQKEIDLTKKAYEAGIGPKVYASKLFMFGGTKKTCVTYIVMDLYRESMRNFLKLAWKESKNGDIVNMMINQSLGLIENAVCNHGFYNYDVKPENMVFKVFNGALQTRMIDFDSEYFIPEEYITTKEDRRIFANILKLQFLIMAVNQIGVKYYRNYVRLDNFPGGLSPEDILGFFRRNMGEEKNSDKVMKMFDMFRMFLRYTKTIHIGGINAMFDRIRFIKEGTGGSAVRENYENFIERYLISRGLANKLKQPEQQ